MRVGVLALQGAVIEHLKSLRATGVEALEVRGPEELSQIDGLILPGGESTTIGLLMTRFGLVEPIRARVLEGMPMWGTCAGMILMARTIEDGLPGQTALGLMDMVVRRNAFGRQVDSFTVPLQIEALGPPPFPAVFIRAPLALSWGPQVEVLVRQDEKAVALRQGHLLTTSFHPELSNDPRFHRWFVEDFVAPSKRDWCSCK